MAKHERLFVLTVTEMKHSDLLERLLFLPYTNVGCKGCSYAHMLLIQCLIHQWNALLRI